MEDKIIRLSAELKAEKITSELSERMIRLEEQTKYLQQIMQEKIDHTKAFSVQAYTALTIALTILGIIGWTTISLAITSKVEDEFKKGDYEKRMNEQTINLQNKIKNIENETDELSSKSEEIMSEFKISTKKKLAQVDSYTQKTFENNPYLAMSIGAILGGLKITPVFGVMPTVTTRNQIEQLFESGKLDHFGALRKNTAAKIEFTFAVINFQRSASDLEQNPFDFVTSIEYWGDKKLEPSGLHADLTLDEAKSICNDNFNEIKTQNKRTILYSKVKDGPILLEITNFGGRHKTLKFKFYGPL